MDKQEVFEQTPAYDRVESLLANPETKRVDVESVVQGSLLEDISTLSEMTAAVEEDGRLKYTAQVDDDDDARHLYVVVDFDDAGSVRSVEMDVGAVAGPLAGSGYNWALSPDGDIEVESRWIS